MAISISKKVSASGIKPDKYSVELCFLEKNHHPLCLINSFAYDAVIELVEFNSIG